MKSTILLLLFTLLVSPAEAQHAWFSYSGGFNPHLKTEIALKATALSDLTPEFCRNVILSYKDRVYLDEQLKILKTAQGTIIYPQDTYFPQCDFLRILNVETFELTVISNGRNETAQTMGDVLSVEQVRLLKIADPGTDISFDIKFRFKHPLNDDPEIFSLKDGKYKVTIVPAIESEFPGGNKELKDYLIHQIIIKFPDAASITKIQQAVVKFIINENGEVINVKMANTSGNAMIDLYIVNAILKMPKWKPAEDAKGIKIKQSIMIPFGGGGC